MHEENSVDYLKYKEKPKFENFRHLKVLFLSHELAVTTAHS